MSSYLVAPVLFLFSVAAATPEVRELHNWTAPPYWTPAAEAGARPDARGPEGFGPREDLAVPTSPLPFIGITPCRIADTRDGSFPTNFGPPSLVGGATGRTFVIPSGPCPGLPASAGAWSLNFTVVAPPGTPPGGYLSVWPTGGTQPVVSTLNFTSNSILANAAVVPAGTGGGINVYVNFSTDLIIDINGYYSGTGVVTSVNTKVGDVTLAAGTNVTITPSGNTLTIAAPGGGGDITEVNAGSGLTGGGTSGAVTLSANFAGTGVGTTVSRSDHDHFGAAWTGTTNPGLSVMQQSASGISLFGSSSGTGETYGVWGQSTSTSGRGLYGLASATTGITYGVKGENSSSSGSGVFGMATATTGIVNGVYGQSYSTSGTGVYGLAHVITGAVYGVRGESYSPAGTGVYGLADATSGVNYGVSGKSTSPFGRGVYGLASSLTGNTFGVLGESSSSKGYGVLGQGATGLRGESTDPDGTGVSGVGGAFGVSGGVDYWNGGSGVLGVNSATTGVNFGVSGRCYAPNGAGVGAQGSGTGIAYVGTGDRGIWAKGTFAGGTFSHPDNVTFWADVSTPTKKITGTGTVSFVQNHPYERNRVVVYTAPEGDEAAVYTRGSARLVNGVARLKLGPTFAWVANPDLGLTAHLTPRGEAAALWVDSVGTEELVVRGPAGSNAAFDYFVWGLRIGFEELPVVQPKRQEAFLPDRAAIVAEYGEQAELQAFSALSRFQAMPAGYLGPPPVDLSHSRALAAAIDAGRSETLAAAGEKHAAERARLEERMARMKERPKSPDAAATSVRAAESGDRPAAPTLDAGRSPAPASVAWAAIQGVDAKLEEQLRIRDAELAALRAAVEALRTEVAEQRRWNGR